MIIKRFTDLFIVLFSSLVSWHVLADQSASSYYGTPPVGWYWGDEPAHKAAGKKPIPPKTPAETLALIKRALDDAKARAVLSPTPENVYAYLVFQHWVQAQSTQFSEIAQNVVAENPSLNYALKNPTTSTIRQVQLQTEHTQKVNFAKELAQIGGLFYFYRGANTMDAQEANTIAQFAKTYRFNLIGIPMDGASLPMLDNRPDTGQSEALGVKALPALFLVIPKTQQTMLITYGYLSSDELLEAIYQRTHNGVSK